MGVDNELRRNWNLGVGRVLGGLGIPDHVGTVVVAVWSSLLQRLAGYSDRIQRFVEVAENHLHQAPKNRYLAGLFAVGTALALLLAASPKGPGSGAWYLACLRAGNQLLAGLTLVVISVWLKQTGRNHGP